MGTVFGKNTTSSSITVAGHKAYYIDSNDAEIVEVEKQGGGGSTASDDVTGTISGVTLPTAHSYTGATFDSLWYYAKGTLSNTGSVGQAFGISVTWYYGTITWEDSSIGDLSSKIAVSNPDGSTFAQQSTIRVHVITSGIIGYHAYDTLDSSVGYGTGQISEYIYANGVHSITFWLRVRWIDGSRLGRIMLRYLDGTTTFYNLSAFDLVNVSGGSLSKATTTDRYDMYNAWNGDITLHALYGSAETIRRNAFKYLLSGTPYWYVIDGEHDTWTDDLSAWGYNEVRPVVELPTVTPDNWVLPDTSSGVTIIQGGSTSAAGKAGAEPREKVAFDNSCVYATTFWRHADNTFAGRVEIAPVNNSGYIGLHNTTNQALEVYWVNYAACSDSTATVVTVCDSSNNAYNAFKYTLNGTDYYYVLDGTQTDWTDDLAGIGYSTTPAPLNGYFDSGGSSGSGIVYQGGYADVYDASGNLANYESGKAYTCLGVYHTGGEISGMATRALFGQSSGKLRFSLDGVTYIQNIFRIEYTVS